VKTLDEKSFSARPLGLIVAALLRIKRIKLAPIALRSSRAELTLGPLS
jgi:hypothetical protein